MPTAASWPETARDRWRSDLADLRTLLRFRARGLVRPRRATAALVGMVVLVLAAAVLPGLHPQAGEAGRAFELLLLIPTLMAGFLLLALVQAIASAGGRELLAREEALAFPITPTTDHLGALLLAPLTIVWLLQGVALLGTTAFALGADDLLGLVAVQVVMLGWLALATAWAQVVAWSAEALRRSERGRWVLRAILVAGGAGLVGLQVSGRLPQVLDAIPTLHLFGWSVAAVDGDWLRWAQALAVVLALTVLGIVLGAWPAHVAARRTPRDEARSETRHHLARSDARTVLGMLVRVDRASVWRAVPMRRGLAVLALGPGLVALAGGLPWSSVVVLPGLVVSGGVLLHGVNAWCLDERGALWRESLPVRPGIVFDARAWVLAEWLLVAAGVTLSLAALRAGVPTAAEAASVLAVVVVVTTQVVAVAMTWSQRRPFAVNMRSARATPAPPAVMVGYSAKLATTTTLTGLCFSITAQASGPGWALGLAVPFLCWSGVRLLRARTTWQDPAERARVVTTVAA